MNEMVEQIEISKLLIDEIIKTDECRAGKFCEALNAVLNSMDERGVSPPFADYGKYLEWLAAEHGEFVRLVVQLVSYECQVENGGHLQYFENGYALERWGDIDNPQLELHVWMAGAFEKFGLNHRLKWGAERLRIMRDFQVVVDTDEFVDGEEGGEIVEVENPGFGSVMNQGYLDSLDEDYYDLEPGLTGQVDRLVMSTVIRQAREER